MAVCRSTHLPNSRVASRFGITTAAVSGASARSFPIWDSPCWIWTDRTPRCGTSMRTAILPAINRGSRTWWLSAMEICLHLPASGLEVALYRLNPPGVEKQFEPIAGPEPLPPLLAPAGPLDPAAIRTLLETERSSPTYPQIGQILFAAVNRGAVGQKWQELRPQCPDLTTYLWVRSEEHT